MIAHYNQTPIHYTIQGKGSCIVLLHGFLLNSSIWSEFIPLLIKKNKVLVIDLPGHGESGNISETHSMELMADVVSYILDINKIEKASFIGHSMGGYISLAFTEKQAHRVDKLILLNSSSEDDSNERKVNRDRAIKIIKHNKDIFIIMAIRSLFPEKKLNEYEGLISDLSKKALTFSTEGIIASIKGMKIRKDRTSVLKSFNGKKYIIAGIEDPIIPYSSLKKVAKENNVELLKVNSGHMSINENPDEIVKIMHFIDFL